MFLVKGDRVAFATTKQPNPQGGLFTKPKPPTPDLHLPLSYGMIHDPEGKDLPRCEVYFGPVRRAGGDATLSRAAKHYFGAQYRGRRVTITKPEGPWEHVADVTWIFYVRGARGGIHPGGYHHPFRGQPLRLDRCGEFYRLSLRDGCIVDDRGFVFP